MTRSEDLGLLGQLALVLSIHNWVSEQLKDRHSQVKRAPPAYVSQEPAQAEGHHSKNGWRSFPRAQRAVMDANRC